MRKREARKRELRKREVRKSERAKHTFVTLDLKTSHKCKFFNIEIYASYDS